MSSSLVPQQRPSASTSHHDSDQESEHIRDIHALTPPHPPPRAAPSASRWDTGSQQSYSMGSEGGGSSENFSSISREFNALVIAGSSIRPTNNNTAGSETIDMGHHHPIDHHHNSLLSRIGEDDDNRDRDGPINYEETNPLAIVQDNHPLDQVDPIGQRPVGPSGVSGGHDQVTSVQRVKKEEVEAKISAWQNNKVAKINNRFKREDAVISGWESEQVQKATSWMKKVERKLEEKRARALEKMQNDVAKARRKAEERRASAEAKRGTKVARVFEVANLMRAVGRAPTKRSFF